MKKAMRARNEKAASQLLFRGGVDKGRCSGLNNFQGPLICIAENTEQVIDRGIDGSFWGK